MVKLLFIKIISFDGYKNSTHTHIHIPTQLFIVLIIAIIIPFNAQERVQYME